MHLQLSVQVEWDCAAAVLHPIFFQAKSLACKEVARLRVSQLLDLQRLERKVEEELHQKKAELRRQRKLLEATQELRNKVIEEKLHRGQFIPGECDLERRNQKERRHHEVCRMSKVCRMSRSKKVCRMSQV